jgi:hypothetical protein
MGHVGNCRSDRRERSVHRRFASENNGRYGVKAHRNVQPAGEPSGDNRFLHVLAEGFPDYVHML